MTSKWYAAEELENAFNKTNNLLFKNFNLGFWLKLALIVFLISGGIGSNFNGSGMGGDNNKGSGSMDLDQVIADIMPYITMIVTVIALFLLIGFVISYIKSVVNFMFIESLEKEKVEFIAGFKRNMGNGLSLFLFNFALGIIGLLLMIIIAAPLVYIALSAGKITIILLILVGIVMFLGLAILSGVIGTLTNDSAIVIMYQENKGILSAWRKLYGILKKEIKQIIIYFVLKIALGIVAGIIMLIIGVIWMVITIIIFIIIAIIAGIIVGVIAGVSNIPLESLMILLIPAALIAVIYFILAGYLSTVITLPIPVFFRYYSILFTQDIVPGLKVLGNSVKKTGKKMGVKKKEKKRKIKVY